jgi:hypothetical protein
MRDCGAGAIMNIASNNASLVATVPGRDDGISSTAPVAAGGISGISVLPASAKVMSFARGLYSLSVGAAPEQELIAGLATPATQIAAIASDGSQPVEVVATAPGAWLGPMGGTVVLKVTGDNGQVMITTYRSAKLDASPLKIQIARLDQPMSLSWGSVPAIAAAQSPRNPAGSEVEAEIVAHIAGIGDQSFAAGDWAGTPGGGRRIEAFSIRPMGGLTARDIEYKAFGPQGRETPWVTDARLCGTRGRGIPLVGFAVRLVGPASEKFDIAYSGAFFSSGAADTRRNGEPCVPTYGDDPLEALWIGFSRRP